MSSNLRRSIGSATRRYGALLGFANDALAAAWCGPSRLKQHLFRAYCRLFGLPELAAHRRYRLVSKALTSRACSCVVDVGARNGMYALANALHRPKTKYIAVDVSRRHLERLGLAVKQLAVRVYPVAGRAEELALPSESADLVLTIEVLQFVDDDRRAVQEIGRILRRGGLWWCEQELERDGPLGPALQDQGLTKRRTGHSLRRLTELATAARMKPVTSHAVAGSIGRWWEGLEARISKHGLGWHLVAFPALRALAGVTANRWTEQTPATVLYCFEKLP